MAQISETAEHRRRTPHCTGDAIRSTYPMRGKEKRSYGMAGVGHKRRWR